MGTTLAEKVWADHLVAEGSDGTPDLLYIDLHLIHEVTSPQAFEGLRMAGRPVRRPDLTIATEDHNTPTWDIDKPIADLTSRTQIETLRRNCEEFGVRLHSLGDIEQGCERTVPERVEHLLVALVLDLVAVELTERGPDHVAFFELVQHGEHHRAGGAGDQQLVRAGRNHRHVTVPRAHRTTVHRNRQT